MKAKSKCESKADRRDHLVKSVLCMLANSGSWLIDCGVKEAAGTEVLN
jgi:hypothetical protein